MDDMQGQTDRQCRPQRVRPDDVTTVQYRFGTPVTCARDRSREWRAMVVAVGNDTDLHVCTLRTKCQDPGRARGRRVLQYLSGRDPASYQSG